MKGQRINQFGGVMEEIELQSKYVEEAKIEAFKYFDNEFAIIRIANEYGTLAQYEDGGWEEY